LSFQYAECFSSEALSVLLSCLGETGIEVIPLVGDAIRNLNIFDFWLVASDFCAWVFGYIFLARGENRRLADQGSSFRLQ
jgi:hypothetical protein